MRVVPRRDSRGAAGGVSRFPVMHGLPAKSRRWWKHRRSGILSPLRHTHAGPASARWCCSVRGDLPGVPPLMFGTNSPLPIQALACTVLGLALGCDTKPVVVTEPSLAEQVALVNEGQSSIIQIEQVAITDDDLAILAQGPRLKVLQLDYEQNQVTDAGIRHLAKLQSLEHLRIHGGNVGDDGLEVLASVKSLRILNLPQGKFTDEGLGRLRESPKLVQLRFGSPQITAQGVARLADFPALRQIHLIGVPLDDEAISALGRIQSLESLYLDDVTCSDAALDSLLHDRPKLHLHVNQLHLDQDPRKGDHQH